MAGRRETVSVELENAEAEQQARVERMAGLAEQVAARAGGDPDEVPAPVTGLALTQEAIRKQADATKVKILRERAEAERKQREARAQAKAEGRPLPPMQSFVVRDYDGDRSVMIDPADGQEAGTPGFIKRHVRTTDSRERESGTRVGQLAAEGYRPIKSRAEGGKPLGDDLGSWMEISPDLEAKRLAHHEGRVVNIRDFERNTLVAMQGEVDREMGSGGAVRFFTDPEHDVARG